MTNAKYVEIGDLVGVACLNAIVPAGHLTEEQGGKAFRVTKTSVAGTMS